MMHGMWDGTMMHGWGLGMWALVFIAFGLVALVVVLTTRNMAGASANAPNESALDLLKRRYAEGEIDDETFRRRRAELLDDK